MGISFFQQTIDAWRMIFLITTVCYVVCAVQYAFLASGEVQWWNTYWEKDDKTKKKEIEIIKEASRIYDSSRICDSSRSYISPELSELMETSSQKGNAPVKLISQNPDLTSVKTARKLEFNDFPSHRQSLL